MVRRASGNRIGKTNSQSQNSRRQKRRLFLEPLEDRRVLAAGFFQGFETDVTGWDAFASLSNTARVASGTNGIASRTGGYHGELTGSVSDATPFGPTTVDGYTATFPDGGYTTSIDIYLDLSGGWANDTRFDWDSAINMPDGNHRRDFIFNAGFYDSSDMSGPGAGVDRFVVSASNNSSPSSAFPKNPSKDPFAITSSGWHTFQHTFYDGGGGVLAVDMTIFDSSGNPLKTWTLSDPTDIIGSTIGGNRYGWFSDQDFAVLAFDNSWQSGADTVYVDDDWTGLPMGTDPDGPGGPATLLGFDAFATIQEGIDAVDMGGTVNVAAGTYAENPLVTKSLTLNGANQGLAGNDPGRGAESTITPSSAFGIEVRADDVIIDGFEITDYNRDGINVRPTNSGPGVATRSNITIRNNYIHEDLVPGNQVNGIVFGESHTGESTDNATISNVTITNNWVDVTDNNTARGIIMTGHFASIHFDSFTIANNVIQAKNNGLFASENPAQYTIDGIEITGNRFERPGSLGINMGNLDATSKINGNTFINNASGAAINFRQAGGEVLNNTFENHTSVGLFFFDATFFPQSSEDATVSGNVFTNNTSRHVGAPAVAVDLTAIENNNTFDGRARVSSLRNIYGTIQAAVDAASAGDTVTVAAGTYNENVSIGTRLTLDGAGPGMTIIDGNSPAITITSGGTSAVDRLVIQDLTATGATGGGNTGSGIVIEGDSSFITFDNVAAVGNTGNGIAINSTGTIQDIQVLNSDLSNNGGAGFRIPSSVTSFTGLLIDNSTIDDNVGAGLAMNPSGSSTPIITDITVSNSSFSNNNTGNNGNTQTLSFFAFHGDAVLDTVTVDHSNAGHAIAFDGRNPVGAAGTISLTDVTVTGTPGKTGMVIQAYNDLSGFSFSGVDLSGVDSAWGDLAVENQGTVPLDLGDTTFSADGVGNVPAIAMWGSGPVDATSADFGTSDNFLIEDSIVHAVDIGGLGLVTWVANNLYVTPDSYAPSYTTAPSIQRAVDAAIAGDTIHVAAGTYSEDLTVDKGLTLLGPNDGIHPEYGSRVAEAIIEGEVFIDASGVTVTGFKITGGPDAISGKTGGADYDDITITYNHLTGQTGPTNTVQPIEFGLNSGGGGIGSSNYVISHNLIDTVGGPDNANTDGDNSTGIVVFNVDGLTVHNNVIRHDQAHVLGRRGMNLDGVRNVQVTNNVVEMGSTTTNAGDRFNEARYQLQISSSDRDAQDVMISENDFSDAYDGIVVLGNGTVTNLTVSANNIHDNLIGFRPGAGLNVAGKGVDGVTIENNFFTDLLFAGIYFGASSGIAILHENVTVVSNQFSNIPNNITGATDAAFPSGPVNASGNWWGSADETTVAASINTAPVDFTPYLDSGTDTDAGTAGFQGDFSTLHVTSQGQQTGMTGRIQEAVDLVTSSTVIVHDGTYVENVLINKNVALISENGRAATTIEGVSGVGALGTVLVTGGTTAVELGRTGQGFTIVGIDNGAPGLENAAVYFQGGHSGAMIVDNEIQANGEHGLLTEYGQPISGFVVDNNEFSGQTFVGSQPGGIGFGSQFTTPNVPRQLVVFGNGGGNAMTASATNITFTNNVISGTAGGISSVDGVSEQGNTLVTLDVANSMISGNMFAGTTTRFGAALRVRRPDTTISGNTFVSTGMSLGTEHMFLQNNTTPIENIVLVNTIDRGSYVHGGSDLSVSISGGAGRATAGDTLHILPGTYPESVDISATGINTNLTLAPGTSPGQVTINGDFTLDANDTLEMEVNGVATPGTDHNQFVVNGVVTLGGAALSTSGTVSGLTAGETVVLIDNDDVDAVNGQHDSLDSGDFVTINGEQFRIFYNGGDGNDVVLIRNQSPLPIVYVDDDWAGTIPGTDPDGPGPATIFGIDSFISLHEAIAAVDPDGDVIVYEGTYDEPAQIAIDKNVDLIGAARATTIVRTTGDTGTSGDARGWFLVSEGVSLNVSGMTFDGNGHLIWQAFRHRGSGVFDDVSFHDIRYQVSGSPYQGTAIAAFGSSSDIDVTNSTFDEIGRIGVLYFGSSVTGTFSGNTYTGKGAGDWLDYALDISAGAQIDVLANTITNNLGVASSDGSISAGILVTTFFGGGTTANIQNNFITGNTTGILVGYDGSDTSAVTIFDNDLSGNTSFAVRSTAPTVDASGNWFGVTDATDVLAEMSGPIDFTPYLDSGTDTDGVMPGFQGDFSTLHVTALGEQTGALERIEEAFAVTEVLTVIVEDGTYDEDVLITKDNFTLRSANGAATTTINGQNTAGSGAVNGAVRVAAGLSGVTIGGSGTGLTINGSGTAGIYLGADSDGFTIEDNSVAAATGQNALLTEGGQSNHTIEGNTFGGSASQLVYVNGAASVANPSTNVDFFDNLFSGSATGPLLGLEADASEVTSNTFSGSTSYAAIELFGDSVSISDNALTGSGSGTGIQIPSSVTGTVIDDTVGANAISGFDVGVEVDNTDVTITGNDFSGGNVTADVRAQATAGSDTLSVNAGGITSGAALSVTIDGTVGTLTVLSLDGEDIFNVAPSLDTVISIDGGTPSPPADPGDTLNFTVPFGETSTDFGTSITTTGGYETVYYTEIETIDITGQFGIAGSGEDDLLVIIASGEDSGTYQLTTDATGGSPVVGPVVSFSGLTGLTFLGLGGDDVLSLTQPSGGFLNLPGGLVFHGGTQNNDGNILALPGLNGDLLRILPPNSGAVEADTITHRFDPATTPANGDDGLITIADATISDGTTTITYTGLEPVLDYVPAADRVFDFTAGAETVTLSDDGDAGDGQSWIDSDLGEAVTFANPSNSLTVQTTGGSGADVVEVEGLDSSFAADLTITGDVNDTAVFQTNTTDTAGNPLLVDTGTITVDATVLTGGATATLEADGDISFTASGSLDTESGSTAAVTLTADADTNSSGGITLADGSSIDAWGGTLTLTAYDDVAIGLLRSSATTTVESTAGAITDSDGGTGTDVDRAGSLVLLAASGVGSAANPLETSVANLEADGGSGGVFVANATALTIGGIGSTVGVSATSGGIDVSAVGGLTVDEDVDATSGNITLTAGETMSSGDDLTVTGSVVISTGSGSILLEAGDDFDLPAGTTYSASGTITATSLDTLADTASSTFNVDGDFDATLATFNGSTVDDAANGDVFNVTPDQDTGDVVTPFQVNGNDPTVVPGDMLNLDIAGLTSPTLSILLGQGNGKWTFGNAGDVTYSSIEQVNRNPDSECYSLQLDMVAAGFDDPGTSDIDYVELEILAGSPEQLRIVVDNTEVYRGDLSSGGMPTLCSFLFIGSDDIDVLDFSQLTTAMAFSLSGFGSTDGYQGTTDIPTAVVSSPSTIGLGLSFDNVDGLHGTAASDTLSMDAALRTHWDIGGDISGVGMTNSATDEGVLVADDATLSDTGNASAIGRPTGADPIAPTGSEQDLAWASIETLIGSATRDDRFDFRDGTTISGTIDGRGQDANGNGDSVDFRDWTTSVTVDLSTGIASPVNGGAAGGLLAGTGGDAGNSIENAFGGDGADSITGDDQPNILGDGGGDDLIEGGPGNDVLRLEPGAAGGGDGSLDVVTDQSGNDTLDFRFARGGITFDADLVGFDQTDPGSGVDTAYPQDALTGGGGNLVSLVSLGDWGQSPITPSPFENLIGSQFNDVLDLDPFEYGVLDVPRHIDGNNPPGSSLDGGPADPVPPGDSWQFDATGQEVYDTGFSISASGRGVVTYESIETLTAFNSKARIVDDGDDTFVVTPHTAVSSISSLVHWDNESGAGFGDDYLSKSSGSGGTLATWNVTGLAAGNYRVSVTYPDPALSAQPNDLATDAPFQVFDEGRLLANIEVNQQTAADDFSAAGALWKELGVFTIYGSTLTVELSNLADGVVLADAVHVERVGAAPAGSTGELTVLEGDELIFDFVSTVDIVTSINQPLAKTFTVRNDGNAALMVHDVELDPGATNVTLTPSITLPVVLQPGDTFDFEVQLDAATAAGFGDFDAQVRIFSDDLDENVPQPAGATGIPDPTAPSRDVDPFTIEIRGVVSNVSIIDDGDTGFGVTGTWNATPTGYLGDEVTTPGDNSGDTATWTFTGLPDGWYRVSATWEGTTNALPTTQASFAVSGIGGLIQSIVLDQTATPSSLVDEDTAWADLGPTINLTGGTIIVTLTDNAGQPARAVLADAVRVERLYSNANTVPAFSTSDPDVKVTSGIELVDGVAVFDFGTTWPGGVISRTFTVENVGGSNLTVNQPVTLPVGYNLVSFDGMTPPDGMTASTLAPGETLDFVVEMIAGLPGTLAGEVAFGTNDPDEGTFHFDVTGLIRSSQLIDDEDAAPEFTSSAGFVLFGSGLQGYNGRIHQANADESGDTAVWTFDGVTPGSRYRVSASWSPGGTRSTDAQYSVSGVTSPATVSVNQQLTPNDLEANGHSFEDLGIFTADGSGTLVVTLSDTASGSVVIADVVRIEALEEPKLQIDLSGTVLLAGDTVDFGSSEVGTPVDRTFTLRNLGGRPLALGAPTLPTGFSLVGSFPNGSSLAVGGSTTFTVRFDAAAAGPFGGLLEFGADDVDANPFRLALDADAFTTSALIIDNTDGSPDYTRTGGFATFGGQGYGGSVDAAANNATASTATWTFDGLTPGDMYRVSATWSAHPNRATDAPFTVTGGEGGAVSFELNQEIAPNDYLADGVAWEDLGGPYTVDANGMLVISVTNVGANEYVIADAIRVQPLVSQPEITVEDSSSNRVVDGGEFQFTSAAIGVPETETFTITNHGDDTLTLDNASLVTSLGQVPQFELVSGFSATSLNPGDTATFTVRMLADQLGSPAATIAFGTSDRDENPFEITLRGEVIVPSLILDDGDFGSGYSELGPSAPITVTTGQGFQNDVRLLTPGLGNTTRYTFTNLTPMTSYQVAATWTSGVNRATDAPLNIAGAIGGDVSYLVNQQLNPSGFVDGGRPFEVISVMRTTGTTLTIEWGDEADGLVVADAIQLIEVAAHGPEIQVTGSPNVVSGDLIDLGAASQGGTLGKTFTITNQGTAGLDITSVSVSGDFTLSPASLSTTIAPDGAPIPLTVSVNTTTTGTKTGTITILNSDADEGTFEIDLTAEVFPLQSTFIIDNNGPTTGGTYTDSGNLALWFGQGYAGDVREAGAGGATETATYTFMGLTPGNVYNLSATWTAFSNRATDATYAISGVTSPGSVAVNQRVAPSGFFDDVNWQSLGAFTPTGTTMTVVLSGSNTGNVIADAVRLDLLSGPEIQVSLDGSLIVDGSTTVDLGDFFSGTTASRTFTIENAGIDDLDILPTLTLPASGFSLGARTVNGSPSTALFDGSTTITLMPGQEATFELVIDTSSTGSYSGTVSFGNNDADENPFNFNVTADVVPLQATFIIDNNGPTPGGTYTDSGNLALWFGQGYASDVREAGAGGATETATYTFMGLTPGQAYNVSATWTAFSNRATDATYAISGVTSPGSVAVNQRVAPSGFFDTVNWQSLGAFTPTGSTMTVVLSGSNTGNVIADAVRLDLLSGPEVQVSLDGSLIVDGSTSVDLGDFFPGTTASRTFTIENAGGNDLDILPTLMLPASGFSLGARTVNGSPSTTLFDGSTTVTLTPGQEATFELVIDTSSTGSYSGAVSFGTSDADENPFNFNVSASVLSSLIIDNGDTGYADTGSWGLYFGQGFASDVRAKAGANGGATATWTFSNLAAGMYRVSATWSPYSNRATNAPFTISSTSGGGSTGPVLVNQVVSPGSPMAVPGVGTSVNDSGGTFADLTLGGYLHTGGNLVVTLTDSSINNWIIADAIRVGAVGMLLADDVAPEAYATANRAELLGIGVRPGNPLAAFGPAPVSPANQAPALTALDVALVLDRAVDYWSSIDTTAASRLENVQVLIADLPSSILGLGSFSTPTIWLDRDAAGRGWNLGSGIGGPAGRVDLLSTVTHELGHVLGYPDLDPLTHPTHVMAGILPTGESRVPLSDLGTLHSPNSTGLLARTSSLGSTSLLVGSSLAGDLGSSLSASRGFDGGRSFGRLTAEESFFAEFDLDETLERASRGIDSPGLATADRYERDQRERERDELFADWNEIETAIAALAESEAIDDVKDGQG